MLEDLGVWRWINMEFAVDQKEFKRFDELLIFILILGRLRYLLVC
jgi:hypothetical protein